MQIKNSKISKCAAAALTISVLMTAFIINALAGNRDRDLDYPYRAMGGLFEGCIVRTENDIRFSGASTNVGEKTLTVYDRPYAVSEGAAENGSLTEIPLFQTDGDYKALCSENIKTYFAKVGESLTEEPRLSNAETGYRYVSSNDNITVLSVGSRMRVGVINASYDEIKAICESDALTDNKYIKAALETAGYKDISFTKTSNYRADTLFVEYYVYDAGAKAPRPYSVYIHFEIKEDKSNTGMTIDFQKDGYDGYELGEYKAISYDEAFAKLKNGEYRSAYTDSDLSGISKDDVLCELVYTDAIDLHYMLPAYKFYVDIKDEAWTKQLLTEKDSNLYFFYYVPAVDIKPENPQTADSPVIVSVAICAASLFGAALIIFKKSKNL